MDLLWFIEFFFVLDLGCTLFFEPFVDFVVSFGSLVSLDVRCRSPATMPWSWTSIKSNHEFPMLWSCRRNGREAWHREAHWCGCWTVKFVEGRDHRYIHIYINHRSYRQIMSDLSQIYPGRFFRTIFRFRVSRCWSLRGIPWHQESEEALRALQIMKHRAPAAGTGETWRDMARHGEKKLNVHHTSHLKIP